MKAYKGFDSNFACNPTGKEPFTYAVGQTYKTDRADPCKSGFHACVDPLDVFRYYPAGSSRFAEVVLSGEIRTEGDKSCATEITIVKEITLSELIGAAVMVRTEAARETGRLETASGNDGAATASGYGGAATASGNYGAATASGERGAATASGVAGAATASGNYGAATASGERGKARGGIGSVLFLAERDSTGRIVAAAAVIVDGEQIKPMTYYTLRGGQITEA